MTVGAAGSPGVLLLRPWWGVTPAVRWWADQLASAGRRVVVPDLFGGATPGTVEEAEPLAQAALADPATSVVVERCADELVFFYGGRPPTGDDVRTRHVDLHVVPDDEFFPRRGAGGDRGGLPRRRGRVSVHRYDGCGHWFAERDSPGYDPDAAALARDTVVARLRTGGLRRLPAYRPCVAGNPPFRSMRFR
jgi:carboxymethylenebutenolidase